MGAPKQKWRAEEEAALKAGVVKHGAGKWRTILKDPEFSDVLHARSNVDLKDKWRNMSVTANGWGSRERGRTVLKRIQHSQVSDDSNPLAITTVDDSDGIVDAKPLRVSSDRITTTKKTLARLEGLIMEAITSLKEPSGSNKTAIAMYIEDQYWSPPNFKRILSSKLKALTASRKLIKTKRKYRIASGSYKEWAGPRASERVQEKPRVITKAQVEAELARIRTMTAEEAEMAAAQAVAEAEAAMAEAEAAAREAEKAEAEAEEAQAFAEAAMLALKSRNADNLVHSLSRFPYQSQAQAS